MDDLKESETRSKNITAILISYNSIETLLGEIGKAIPPRPIRTTRAILHYLGQNDLIAPGLLDLYANLREGRNIVAHGQAVVSQREIDEYVRQATFLEVTLSELLSQIRSGETKVPPRRMPSQHIDAG